MNSLLQTYQEDGLVFRAGNSLKKCNDPITLLPIPERHIPGKMFPVVREECLPDTLYSWGSLEKAERIFAELKSLENWKKKLSRPIYTSPFPAATFPYGQVPIRIKLKPKMKFVSRADYCPKKISKDNSQTVYYATKLFPGVGQLYEIIICSVDVVESISYGTQEHYDETVRDIVWSTTPNRELGDYYSYTQSVNGQKMAANINFSGEPFVKRADGETSAEIIDGHKASIESLFENLLSFKVLVDKSQGEIIFHPQYENTDHFSTKVPMYYNPD